MKIKFYDLPVLRAIPEFFMRIKFLRPSRFKGYPGVLYKDKV
jgi:hypothetical protein